MANRRKYDAHVIAYIRHNTERCQDSPIAQTSSNRIVKDILNDVVRQIAEKTGYSPSQILCTANISDYLIITHKGIQ